MDVAITLSLVVGWFQLDVNQFTKWGNSNEITYMYWMSENIFPKILLSKTQCQIYKS